MSTKMSNDLNITRSSTRVHVPPGGNTTISFGDAHSTTQPALTQAATAFAAGNMFKIKFDFLNF